MWLYDYFFGSKPEVDILEEVPVDMTNDAIFSVDTFNEWFNDPENGAVYANSGIFLRIDKLSMGQIEDYMDKRWGIDNKSSLYDNSSLYLLMLQFKEDIAIDWRKKSKKK